MSRSLALLIVLALMGAGLGLLLKEGKKEKETSRPKATATAAAATATPPAAPSAPVAPVAEPATSPPAQAPRAPVLAGKAPLPPTDAPTDLAQAASAMQALTPGKGPGPSPEEPPAPGSAMKVLEEQVSYLQGQVDILRKENSTLLDKLASITKSPAKPAQNASACEPPSTAGESPDFVGVGIELVRTRALQDVPIPTISVDRSVVQNHISAWLTTQFPAQHGRLQGRALAALGAIPEPVDTVALKAAFLSHQIGAWYVPEDQSLYLAETGELPEGEKPKENALGLAYGYLFKRFGSKLLPSGAKSMTLDARLSRESTLAGDASLTRFLHTLQNPKSGGGGGVGEDPDDPSRSVPIPNFLRQLELASFSAGFDFMQALHSIGEWDQVNAAYNRAAIATAEILDPELYLNATPFVLQPIDIPDAKVNGDTPFWQDTLGPIATVLLLRQHAPEPIAADTAPGWANDKLLTYAAKGKTREHAVWQTLWRDTNAADSFFSAMRQGLLSRYKGAKPAANAPDGVFQIESGGRTVVMQRTNKGIGVLFIDAADAAFAKAAVAKFAK